VVHGSPSIAQRGVNKVLETAGAVHPTSAVNDAGRLFDFSSLLFTTPTPRCTIPPIENQQTNKLVSFDIRICYFQVPNHTF